MIFSPTLHVVLSAVIVTLSAAISTSSASSTTNANFCETAGVRVSGTIVDVAIMSTFPLATAVTKPFSSTVAISSFDEDHTTVCSIVKG